MEVPWIVLEGGGIGWVYGLLMRIACACLVLIILLVLSRSVAFVCVSLFVFGLSLVSFVFRLVLDDVFGICQAVKGIWLMLL
jgi:hypothetical protein